MPRLDVEQDTSAMTTTAPHATTAQRTVTGSEDRVTPRRPFGRAVAPAVVATVLGTVLALFVLLQMLPQTGTDAAALASEHAALITIPLFLAAAMAAVLCVALILVQAGRAEPDAR